MLIIAGCCEQNVHGIDHLQLTTNESSKVLTILDSVCACMRVYLKTIDIVCTTLRGILGVLVNYEVTRIIKFINIELISTIKISIRKIFGIKL